LKSFSKDLANSGFSYPHHTGQSKVFSQISFLFDFDFS
jgi:hypothetical protein